PINLLPCSDGGRSGRRRHLPRSRNCIMTILTELAALYERRAERAGWPRPGYSTESISAEVVLRVDGTVEVIRPLTAPDNNGRMRPQRVAVPSVSRTSGIRPALLWDKTAYALGVTAALGE